MVSTIKAQHSGHLNGSDSTKVSYKILPVAWYVPETGFTIGLTGISAFRLPGESSKSRASSILFDAAVTLRGKVFAFIPFEIYKGEDKWRLKGELGMYKYLYSFFGNGPRSFEEDKETYNVVFPRVLTNLTRQVIGPLAIGAGYRFDYFNITKIEEEGLLAQLQPVGTDGGTISNVFFTLLYDNRDHVFDTKKGYYMETILEHSFEFLGSSFNYDKFEVDARSFHPLSENFTLANNVFFSWNSDGIPFFTQPYLSTSRRGRGYADRRWMDRTLLNVQSELRFPLFWRIEGALSLSGGMLGDNPSDLTINDIKWAYGGGFRYIVDENERNKIRIDLGFTDEAFNFYITANEAF